MRRPLGMFLILIGVVCALVGAYPWLYLQYLRFIDSRPYHYYFLDDSAKAACLAIVAVGIALIGTGIWLFSNRHTEE
jgi:uncharacterized membrane protein